LSYYGTQEVTGAMVIRPTLAAGRKHASSRGWLANLIRLIDRLMMHIFWRAIFRTADGVDRVVRIGVPHFWVTCL